MTPTTLRAGLGPYLPRRGHEPQRGIDGASIGAGGAAKELYIYRSKIEPPWAGSAGTREPIFEVVVEVGDDRRNHGSPCCG
ncbi:MAG: hypothetical protein ACLPZJ_15615 [Terriglobales bacterium]